MFMGLEHKIKKIDLIMIQIGKSYGFIYIYR